MPPRQVTASASKRSYLCLQLARAEWERDQAAWKLKQKQKLLSTTRKAVVKLDKKLPRDVVDIIGKKVGVKRKYELKGSGHAYNGIN